MIDIFHNWLYCYDLKNWKNPIDKIMVTYNGDEIILLQKLILIVLVGEYKVKCKKRKRITSKDPSTVLLNDIILVASLTACD